MPKLLAPLAFPQLLLFGIPDFSHYYDPEPMTTSQLLFKYTWFFFALLAVIGLEALWYRFALKRRYPWHSFPSSMGVFLGYRIVAVATGFIIPIYVYSVLWKYRLVTLPTSAWWYFPLLFLLFDFLYYWSHRAQHEVRFFWATHYSHHSGEELNVATASRFPWIPFGGLSAVFFFPLVFLGFEPLHATIYPQVHTAIMFWIHVDWIPKIPGIEGIVNTPSAHRVHHAKQPEYLNRNYGGLLVIWDRMFGTYVPERDDLPPQFGLVEPNHSKNPFVISLYEWGAMLRDVWRAPDLRTRWLVLAGKPGTKLSGV